MSGSGETRTVVVTGAASGIGAAIAARLAAEGWSVVGVDRAESKGSTASRLVDLADEAAVARLATSLRGADALVHAAGFMRTAPLGEIDLADGDAMWAVHVRALTVLANGLAPSMGAGGRILAIGSRTSAGAAGRSQYTACKAAVTGLIRSWAMELVARGVTANVIAPAATETGLLSAPSRESAPPKTPPMGRFIRPHEVAAYAAFILSRDADAITGQELLICGGASL
ncbi:SDR family NAD(P)-dependent oxidoreductase [Phenylobacterium sp.]|uniref:SDR family NAD(P)-dependent oxidoreductase n=1 Tax=Phenylobacterium sp. TaxID=1871053 RepID=UPI002C95033B|nr:SDR family oxidoreductase [Phenylobacterium sp.]HLZ73418.1 SDR family oxidoreductase [Phenylobacterium sp.]